LYFYNYYPYRIENNHIVSLRIDTYRIVWWPYRLIPNLNCVTRQVVWAEEVCVALGRPTHRVCAWTPGPVALDISHCGSPTPGTACPCNHTTCRSHTVQHCQQQSQQVLLEKVCANLVHTKSNNKHVSLNRVLMGICHEHYFFLKLTTSMHLFHKSIAKHTLSVTTKI